MVLGLGISSYSSMSSLNSILSHPRKKILLLIKVQNILVQGNISQKNVPEYLSVVNVNFRSLRVMQNLTLDVVGHHSRNESLEMCERRLIVMVVVPRSHVSVAEVILGTYSMVSSSPRQLSLC